MQAYRLVPDPWCAEETPRSAKSQPRTLEVFRFLGVVDDVLALALPAKSRCDYKLPGGVEPLRIMAFVTPDAPSPAKPYVRQFIS